MVQGYPGTLRVPSGKTAPMGKQAGSRGESAELSSLATALEELTKRLSEMAESLAGTEHDSLASDLFSVERSLQAGHRRLTKVVEGLT
jgi:hypothetical protein